MKPYRKYYDRLINRLGIQIDIINKIKNRVFAYRVLPNRLTLIYSKNYYKEEKLSSKDRGLKYITPPYSKFSTSVRYAN